MQFSVNKFYLYLSSDADLVAEFTDLSIAELEALVGRFDATHDRAGQLKGKFVQWRDGRMQVVHHFTGRVLWAFALPEQDD